MLSRAARACICDRPRCLLAGLELCFRLRGKRGVRNCGVVGQAYLDVYQDWENVGVNDGLDLLSVTSCDV